MEWKELVKEAGGASNLLTIGGIGAALNFLALPKPFGYDIWLDIPGVLGALYGYYFGLRSNGSKWYIMGGLGSSIALFFLYMALVNWGGVPPWYDWVLYPCFIGLNVSIFWYFGAVGLRIGNTERSPEQS